MPETPPGPPINMMLDELCPKNFHMLSLSLTVLLVFLEHELQI